MKNLENLEKELTKTLKMNTAEDSVDLIFELISMAVCIVFVNKRFVKNNDVDAYMFDTSEHMKMYIDKCMKTETTKH